MKSYALLHEYEVFDVVKTDKDINTLFTPDIAAQYVPCTDEVEMGWIYDGTTFSPPHEPTPAEIEALQAEAHREERDQKLTDCDWTQLPDSPLTPEKKAEWAVYRQELRDITTQPNWPTSIVWPVEPV